jgi:outer membrane protein OmpA-like peptidoglycan-associated protein/flagellar hook assembly protein FlgD
MKKYIAASVIIFTAYTAYGAENLTGLRTSGDNAINFAMGGAGLTYSTPTYSGNNFALFALYDRAGVSMSYGDLGKGVTDGSAAFFVPGSRGVFGGTVRYMKTGEKTGALNTLYDISLGFGKEVYPGLKVGLGVNTVYGNDGKKMYYAGITGGSIYTFPLFLHTLSGFGFYEPSVGFSFSGGYWRPSGNDNANMNRGSVGWNGDFYRTPYIKIGLYNDYGYYMGESYFLGRAGLQLVLNNSYILRCGTLFPDKTGYGLLSAGAGYRYEGSELRLGLDYSMVRKNNGSLLHYAEVTIQYGELDRNPPEVNVKPSVTYISPNYDGVKDYTIINLDVKDKSGVRGWLLQIFNRDMKVVKEFRSSNRVLSEGISFTGFFRNLFSTREELVVPRNIIWDGTDQDGLALRDGDYTYSFMAWDVHDNYSVKQTGALVVDNTPPKGSIAADYLLFSPNGDKNKDELVIRTKTEGDKNDRWTAVFYDASGKKVRSYIWNTSDVPSVIKWDGRDDGGVEAPEGVYTFKLDAADDAGNRIGQSINEIILTRQYEVADVSASVRYYSYLTPKPVLFSAALSNKTGLRDWKLTIEDAEAKEVKSITGSAALPGGVEWDGRDRDGKKLGDGKYYYIFSAQFESGNNPRSFKKEIIFDSTPPKLALSYKPSLFSPDGDGENDLLTILPKAGDENGLARWDIKITNPTSFLFKSFSGSESLPSDIIWDGRGAGNELVESATDYAIEFTAFDKAGNSTRLEGIKLPVDILVVVTERGLKIKISNIEFGFASAKLLTDANRILDRVAVILEKYNSYNIIIEGHTDDIGQDDANLKLSEERAKSVYDYLAGRGIKKERLSFRGMGETSPYVPNKDNESRRKNRRVEFLLEKNIQVQEK